MVTSQDPSRVAGALRSRWIARRPTARGKESLRRQKVPGKTRPSLEPDPGAAQGSPNPSGWNLPARPHLVSPALKLHRGLSNGHLGHGAKPGPHPGGSSPCPRVTPTPSVDRGWLPPTPRAEERQMYYLLDDQGVGVGGQPRQEQRNPPRPPALAGHRGNSHTQGNPKCGAFRRQDRNRKEGHTRTPSGLFPTSVPCSSGR